MLAVGMVVAAPESIGGRLARAEETGGEYVDSVVQVPEMLSLQSLDQAESRLSRGPSRRWCWIPLSRCIPRRTRIRWYCASPMGPSTCR